MPIQKVEKTREPPWKEWDTKAQKSGERKTVYSVNGDQYIGDWRGNKKNGKGIKIWNRTGAKYEGDWRDDKRHGYGMYSVPNKDKPGEMQKKYAGGWKNDFKHGYGTNYYSDTEYYEGEWYNGKRSGWGRMYYKDGAVYEGEWFDDKRNGLGLLRLANHNRYEGSWKDGMKHGPGKFLYLDKGQIYTGYWIQDIAKSGNLEDFGREKAPNPPAFPVPKCKLVDPLGVVREAIQTLESESFT